MKNVKYFIIMLFSVSFMSAQRGVDFYPPDKADGLYAHPADPTKFITISSGMEYAFDCSPALVWNDMLKKCDWSSGPGPVNGLKLTTKVVYEYNGNLGFYVKKIPLGLEIKIGASGILTYCEDAYFWDDCEIRYQRWQPF